jgi:hypothetical protein
MEYVLTTIKSLSYRRKLASWLLQPNKVAHFLLPLYSIFLPTNPFCVTFEVLKAASIKMTVFWDAASCNLAEAYRRFGDIYASIIRSMLSSSWWRHQVPLNHGKFLPDKTGQHPRRESPLYSPLWEPEKSPSVHRVHICNWIDTNISLHLLLEPPPKKSLTCAPSHMVQNMVKT